MYKAYGCLDGHAAFYRLDSPEEGGCISQSSAPGSSSTLNTASCTNLLLRPQCCSEVFGPADERVLWYSEAFRDWNISPGLVPDPVHCSGLASF